jgi:hypothetical protein
MSLDVTSAIDQAYKLIGVVDNSESAEGEQVQIGLSQLNELLGQLNLDQMFPFSREIITYDVVSAENSYTIGATGADITATRPVYIQSIQYYSNTNTSPLPTMQMDLNQLLDVRSSDQSSGAPGFYAVNYGYPNSTIYFDLRPQAGSHIQIVYNKELSQVSIGDTMAIPNEYNELIITGVAVAVGVYEQVDDGQMNRARFMYDEALRRIKRNNQKHRMPLVGVGGCGDIRKNNIYTGRSRCL